MKKITAVCLLPVFILSVLFTTFSCKQAKPISTPPPIEAPSPASSTSTTEKTTLQHYSNGKVLAKQGNYEQAILEYTKSLELFADNTMAYQSRGDAYLAKRDYDSAIKDYTAAIENIAGRSTLLDISISYLSYLGRSNAYYEKGDYEWAKIDYNKALEKRQEFEKAYGKALGDYQRLKQLGDALEAK